MGLDNGLYLRVNEDKHIDFPEEVVTRGKWNEVWDYNENGEVCVKGKEIDMCYWRKCWNIRQAIMNVIDEDYDGDGGMIELSIGSLKKIWHEIFRLTHKKEWEDGESIWTWKEMRWVLDQDLINIEWLIENMQRDPELEVYFLDSY